MDGYHDHEEFVRVVEARVPRPVDDEVRDSMGLVSEGQYRELFERYVQHVSHWVKGEKMRNRVTGEMERPDEKRMAEMEAHRHAAGARTRASSAAGSSRRSAPTSSTTRTRRWTTPRIFPDLFRRLRDHFFEERKRVLRRNTENMLKYLSDERGTLSLARAAAGGADARHDARALRVLRACAKDAILFLMRKRYGS